MTERFERFAEWFRNTYTWHRWMVNPFQMYATAFLVLVSTAQVGLGISPSTVVSELDRSTQMSLSFCNLVGASIVLYGLHLRGTESSLWMEMSGYVSLIFVLSVYIYLLTTHQYLANTTYGFAFSQAFVYASIHRSIQIFRYKRMGRKKRRLSRHVNALTEVLEAAGVDTKELPKDE